MKHGIIIAAALMCAVSSVKAAEENSTFSAAGLAGISIKIPAGEITLEGIETNEVKVEQQFAPKESTNSNRENCAVTFKQSGGILVYAASDNPFRPKGQHCEVNLRITAPKELLLRVFSDMGPVKVSGFIRTVFVDVKMGDIQLQEISGDNLNITAKTGNITGKDIKAKHVKADCNIGNIDLEGLVGTADVFNHNGRITLGWEHAPKSGIVDIHSSKGDVLLTFPEDARFISKIKAAHNTLTNEFPPSTPDGFNLNIKASLGEVKILKLKI
jgi:hypothetical protein